MRDDEPAVWLLNLDAERELAAGRPLTPNARLAARMEAVREAARRALFRPGDALLGEREAGGRVGRAWCRTATARRRLEAAGARVEDWPAPETVRRVNDRAFAAALGAGPPGARFVHPAEAGDAEAEVMRVLASAPPVGVGAWRVKRAFGVAGRGQRVLAPGAPTEAERAWLAAGLRRGGLQLEPELAIRLELVVHGWVAGPGRWKLGVPREQAVRGGAWQATVDLGEARLPERWARRLRAGCEEVAEALAAAGYRGPFGLDAYVWEDGGEGELVALSEINARYTMGWRV